jgi:Lon protease-like protein
MNENRETISIFPLPGTIFYPNTHLPLHIFEPRYKQMVADALKGNRLIGMIIFKPGWEENYYQSPEIVAVGCVGRIERAVSLDEGKYNLALLGLHRFQIVREITGKPWRQAEVIYLENRNDRVLDKKNPVEQWHPLIPKYQEYLSLLPEKEERPNHVELQRCETLGNVVDQIAYDFNMSADQKQAYLEELDVLQRVRMVESQISFKTDLIKHSKVRQRDGFDARLN